MFGTTLDDRPPQQHASVITARLYSPDDAKVWDAFVDNSINGTFMHTRRFLSYHPAERFSDQSLLFCDLQGKVVAVLSAAAVEQDGQRVLRSHPGSSYGGLIFGDDLNTSITRGTVQSLIQYAATHDFRSIWMRHTEKVFHRRHCEEIDEALFLTGFQLQGRELSCAVPTAGSRPNEAPAVFLPPARRAVRKALKSGIVAQPTVDFAGYWQMLAENLHEQHGVQPTHTLEEILRLTELFPDRILLVGGFADDQLVAGVVLFLMNQTAAHTMYMAQNYQFQSRRPLNLVLANALAECAGRGIPWLNYGISSIPGTRGLEMNTGLYNFKRSCGGEGVVRDLFYKEL